MVEEKQLYRGLEDPLGFNPNYYPNYYENLETRKIKKFVIDIINSKYAAKTIKAYKVFKKIDNKLVSPLTNVIYEPDETKIHTHDLVIGASGFHACKELHKCFMLFPNIPNFTVYWEVECGGRIIEDSDMICCSRIKMIRQIDTSNVVNFFTCGPFVDDIAPICRGLEMDRNCNFINTKGELISLEWFDNVRIFHNGFAVVELNKKYNFIDKKGRLLSNKWFDRAQDFWRGETANVVINGENCYINKYGEITCY